MSEHYNVRHEALLAHVRLHWPNLYTVGQKTVPMFGCFAKIEVEQIKKIR